MATIIPGVDGRSLTVTLTLDANGNIIPTTGPNLVIDGQLTINGTNYNGILLEGDVEQFGFQYTGTTTNSFDFRMALDATNPGLLASYYGSNNIGITMLSQASTFTGSFASNFTGGTPTGAGANGAVGPISPLPPALGSLGGTVYEDFNNNGIDTAPDVPLQGVEIVLSGTDYQGNPVSETTYTGIDGSYVFGSLEPSGPSGYTIDEIQSTVPAPLLPGIDTVGTLGGNNTVQDEFSAIPLTAGQNGVFYNFAQIPPASVSGIVYCDTNTDGIYESGTDMTVSGAVLTLTGTDDRGDSVLLTTNSLSDGTYDFAGLRPGTYTVSVSDSNPALTPETASSIGPATVPVGTSTTGDDFGYVQLTPVSGQVVNDNTSTGVSGVTITLTGVEYTGASLTPELTTTASDGTFNFGSLLPGSYTITEGTVAGLFPDQNNTGSYSFSLAGCGNSSVFTTFGEVPPGSISGVVWQDNNDNGVQDAGEPNLANVLVDLYQGNTLISSLDTLSDGSYDFTGLAPGAYTVQVISPNNESFTLENQGTPVNSVVNAAGMTAALTLAGGQNIVNEDAGVLPVDLAIAKTVDNSTPNVGANATFAITVSNAAGYSNATDVTVADLLPTGITFVSATPSQGSYSNGIWTVGGIAAGSGATLQIVGTATAAGFPSSPTPSETNTATITASDQADVGTTLQASATINPQEVDLTIAKTVSNSTPYVGTNDTFTVTLSNLAGYSGATNVSVSDLLPAGITFVSATPSQGTYSGGVWSVGSLASGSSATMLVVGTVTAAGFPSSPTPSETNTATITAVDQPDVNPVTSASVTINPQEVDLTIAKTVSNSTPNVGTNDTFTVTLSNLAGYSGAMGVSVSDLLPAGITLVSATPSQGTYSGGIWTVGSLASGSSATMVVVGTVTAAGFPSSPTPSETNTATITAVSQTDVNTVKSASVTVNPQEVDLTIAKTVSNSTPNVGTNDTFTVTLSNLAGYSTATGVTVTDVLPTGITLVSDTPSQGTYSSGVWNVGSLAAGSTVTLVVVGDVTTFGTLTNTATITAVSQPDVNPITSASVSVNSQEVDLTIAKTVSNSTPNVGTNDTFTVTLSNLAGYSTATGITVSDVLPSGITFVSATPSQGTYSSGIWTVGSLASGSSATMVVVGTATAAGFPSSPTPSETNTATITAVTQTDVNTVKSASATISPQEVDLTITKTVTTSKPTCGTNDTFTVTLSNATGYSTATGITVTDVLPTGITLVSDTPSQGTYSSGVWNVGSLAAGSTVTLVVVGDVTTMGTLTNTATITAVNQPDVNPVVSASVTVNPATSPDVDLTIVKTVSNSTPNVGTNDTFTVTLSNATGYTNATGISVTDKLPTGITFVSDTPSQGTYTSSTGVWAVGSLAAGSTATLVVVGTATAAGFPCSPTPSETNTATITAVTQTDANTVKSSSVTIYPQEVDLTIAKTVSNSTPNVGTNDTFTVTLSNLAGYSTATGLTVTDVLPTGITLVSDTPSQGTYSSGVWTVGSLAAGSTATLVVVGDITATGTLTNTATITAVTQTEVNTVKSASVSVNPLNNSISGTVYDDLTGNGLTSDDTPLAGVVVNLYKNVDGTGVPDAADGAPIETFTTGASGTYSFTDLPVGSYIVTETVPTGEVETAPNLPNYYDVTVTSTSKTTGLNFDNYIPCTVALQNVSYKITNGSTSTTVSTLTGNTAQGDTVSVTFTVPTGASPMVYSLVSYNAPGPTYQASQASQQTIFQDATGTYGPGTYTLTVTIPNNYYQIDFVCGAAINQFGPSGSNIFYAAEDRLFSSDNSGLNTDVVGEAGSMLFWSSTSGQALIKSFGGSSTSTVLGTWLANLMPNVFGGTLLGNKQNTTVAAEYLTLYNLSGQKNQAQVMATALNVYASTTSLGGTAASSYGFAVTAAGLGAADFNIGTNGAAFGVANNSTITVTQMLSGINSLSSANSLFKGVTADLNDCYNELGLVNGYGGII
jgi:uncharacterized repeat protein (TIGR01451 family)